MQAAVVRHTEIDDIHTPLLHDAELGDGADRARARARDRRHSIPSSVASAIWVGTELMTRLGVAIDGARVLYRGVWPTYFAAPLAAAAIAARMWQLSEDETAHALSLALMLTAGRSGRFQGRIPGRSVILAWRSPPACARRRPRATASAAIPICSTAHGCATRTASTADLDALTAGLGRGSVYAQLSLKPFCSAKQAIAATEALMTLDRRRPCAGHDRRR